MTYNVLQYRNQTPKMSLSTKISVNSDIRQENIFASREEEVAGLEA